MLKIGKTIKPVMIYALNGDCCIDYSENVIGNEQLRGAAILDRQFNYLSGGKLYPSLPNSILSNRDVSINQIGLIELRYLYSKSKLAW